VVHHAYVCGLYWCKMHMYAGCWGAIDVCTQAVLVQGTYIFKNVVFLEEKLSSGLEKNESKRAKGQVCMCREIQGYNN
jgi:hypothetical protein